MDKYCQACGAPLYRSGCTNILCTGAIVRQEALQNADPVQLCFLLGKDTAQAPIPFSDQDQGGDQHETEENAI